MESIAAAALLVITVTIRDTVTSLFGRKLKEELREEAQSYDPNKEVCEDINDWHGRLTA